jgi:hypothetical protein
MPGLQCVIRGFLLRPQGRRFRSWKLPELFAASWFTCSISVSRRYGGTFARGVLTMNPGRPIDKLACCGLVLLLALGIHIPRGAAGQIVSGGYKVTQTKDLGMQMRVTMQIRLVNASEDKIFVTQAHLRGFLHPGKSEDKPAGVILEPHGSSEFTQDFTIAKQEYELWSRGVRPHLGLRVQVGGGAETTKTISLMQLPGSR